MAKKKILLIEADKDMKELFVSWLEEEAYIVSSLDSLQEVQPSLSKDKFDALLIDIDYPEIAEGYLELVQTLKVKPGFIDLPIVILTYKQDSKKIASAVEAGADSFVLKPFETDSFLKRIEVIFKEIELKKQGKKNLDLDYINYLIEIMSESSREDFFLLSSVIFNKLIMNKICPILGDPTIKIITERLRELIGEDYSFMTQVELSDKQIFMDKVKEVSKEIPVEKLTAGFKDYIYGFLQLVQMLTSNILMEREEFKDK